MNTVIQDPEILMQCSVEGRKDTFCDCNKNLELVQKGLKERPCFMECNYQGCTRTGPDRILQ